MSTRRYVVMLAAVLAPLATWFASAEPVLPEAVPAVAVSLEGYDLSSPKGADALYSRIQSAAEVVCRVDESRETERIARAQACYRSAVGDAVAQVNQPTLSAMHARHIGKPSEIVRTARR